MQSFKSYLIKTVAFTTTFLLLIAGFNALIDPFVFFNSPIINKLNKNKPDFQTHIRTTKAHQIRIQKPETIILGSSRAEFGINPEHPGFMSSSKKTYNLALQSINIYETFSYLKHAQAIQPLKQVIIGLDFFMFNNNKSNESDFDKTRLAPMKYGWFLDIFRALFTYDGLLASINTIEKQNDNTSIQYFKNGFRNDTNNWARIQKKGGHRQAAINNESYTLHALDGFTFFEFSEKPSFIESLSIFQEIIRFSKEHDIDLHLFISPIHARKLQIFHQLGLWEKFEHWKKQLVQIVELSSAPFSIWDFTGYNEITTEYFPRLKDAKQQMKWYWESSHYKKETGDLVLDIILNHTLTKRKAPVHFGIKLTSQNIKQHLINLRKARKRFITNHPEIVNEIKQIIKNTTSKREKLIQQNPNLIPLSYFKKNVDDH